MTGLPAAPSARHKVLNRELVEGQRCIRLHRGQRENHPWHARRAGVACASFGREEAVRRPGGARVCRCASHDRGHTARRVPGPGPFGRPGEQICSNTTFALAARDLPGLLPTCAHRSGHSGHMRGPDIVAGDRSIDITRHDSRAPCRPSRGDRAERAIPRGRICPHNRASGPELRDRSALCAAKFAASTARWPAMTIGSPG